MSNKIFFSVDLECWVFGTIEKVQQGREWDDAWKQTYREIGGESEESGAKGCPMAGTRTLYVLGRIKDSDILFQDLPLHEVRQISKNGAYAILALDILSEKPEISRTELWYEIKNQFRENLQEEPANSNQGGPTVAFKLWHLGLINKQ